MLVVGVVTGRTTTVVVIVVVVFVSHLWAQSGGCGQSVAPQVRHDHDKRYNIRFQTDLAGPQISAILNVSMYIEPAKKGPSLCDPLPLYYTT